MPPKALKGSHLRQVSHGSSSGEEQTIQSKLKNAVQEQLLDAGASLTAPVPRICNLGIHSYNFVKQDVLINPKVFPSWNVTAGTQIKIEALVEVTPPRGSKRHGGEIEQPQSGHRRESTRQSDAKASPEYVFVVQKLNADYLTKHPNLQISVSDNIASALGFFNNSRVRAIMVDEGEHIASYVEIAFRDAYLTRSDMWRLVISELAGKSMFKGQKLTFMNTINAQVKTIYQNGKKSNSAFFGTDTKVIFRSESARYVLFLQMSKEMWEFDTDGTGDIMFHKVIDGFLPELFKRWQDIGARHLVSIIMFTRLEYERPMATSLEPLRSDYNDPSINFDTENLPYKDFYRVLISDMSSGSWNEILDQLKKDFKTFLRDVSMRKTFPTHNITYDKDEQPDDPFQVRDVISGRPTCASKGNILEAINVASSQFSSDYIDRDLVRTGLSIIVVTPGTGIFEVDYNLLSLTTDILIDNGVGIDLVCLSRMPLHSVPLFKYKQPRMEEIGDLSSTNTESVPASQKLGTSFGSSRSHLNPSHFSHPISGEDIGQSSEDSAKDPWHYGIPHWVDVSFWTPPDEKRDGIFGMAQQKPFIPRVKMHEVQMMGVMENEMNNISIPYLSPPAPPFDPDADSHLSDRLKVQPSLPSIHSSPEKHSGLPPGMSSSPSDFSQPASQTSEAHPDLKRLEALAKWMDDYDDQVFLHPRDKKKTLFEAKYGKESSKPKGKSRAQTEEPPSMASSTSTFVGMPPPLNMPSMTSPKADRQANRKSSISSTLKSSPTTKTKPAKPRRQFSFGFAGFGAGPAKSTPIAEVTSENAHFDTLAHRVKKSASPRPMSPSRMRSGQAKLEPESSTGKLSPHLGPVGYSSRPIPIKASSRESNLARTPIAEHPDYENVLKLQEKIPADRGEPEPEVGSVGLNQTLSPSRAMAPWLTVVKPWNPSTASIKSDRPLGRWQHVFPKPLSASKMKWKSLCSPASVPLTTEGFPTSDQLSQEYEKAEYTITSSDQNVTETTKGKEVAKGAWLMREMISARFSHGFQIVLSNRLAQSFSVPPTTSFSIFDDNDTTQAGAKVFMLRGSSIHILHAISDNKIEVTWYNRRPAADIAAMRQESFMYRPAVRTTLSNDYVPREISISTLKEPYDWERLDAFISGHEAQQTGSYPNLLNFWRARYVLIPIEPSSNTRRRAAPVNEDNDEEIRLEGIRKMTQLWQKNRYVRTEDRRFKSVRKREDANPLDIIYQTRNPSAIVAAEMNEALLLESDATNERPAQLLPDKDLFERSNLKLRDLANTMQGEKGVRMMDRRWHWRLHYNCFVGMEFTTWLLNNFRDVDKREEAVELGNELMKEGLFVHVEKRHNFRDGNFFFQLAPEYCFPRAEAIRNSWFGKSVPSTPMAEFMRNSPLGGHSRLGTNDSQASDGDSSTTTKKQKLGVALSKSLVYDVDPRGRSYRRELITLHYDRISSADDCYHVRIDWMNVTPKLIEDAIASWASLAERNGLHLVEVPIHEASKINEFHPFRGPYIIKLAKLPPDTQPQTYFDASSLSATKSNANHIYHKAILRKFNFVLDLEAARDFPASVDVEYSWGKPDYELPQYISREGVLLVQITDEGDFLLLANRLYNNRTALAREAYRNQSLVDTEALHRNIPRRVTGPARFVGSPSSSPHHSPVVKATADVGLGANTKAHVITPESIKNELEAFCHDVKALEKFYEEVLNANKAASTPGPQTPAVGGVGTPRTGAQSGLDVPPTLTLK